MRLGIENLDLIDLAINLIRQRRELDIQFKSLVVVIRVGDHATADHRVQRDPDCRYVSDEK